MGPGTGVMQDPSRSSKTRLPAAQADSGGIERSMRGARSESKRPAQGIRHRNKISPEVQDWLDRVVLPNLKKVIFHV